MPIFTISFGPKPEREYTTIEEFSANWVRGRPDEAGSSYVYAFRDVSGSVFYIGKGQGDRAHEAIKHRHGRLGYYVATFLAGAYTVEILRSGLSPDDAELLEAELLETFGPQLVNWADNFGLTGSAEAVDRMRSTVAECRQRAQLAADGDRLDEAVSLCREGLAYMSDWERSEHDAEVRELERLAPTHLAARADLRKLQDEYVPFAPVLACEMISDLTRYLCKLGRPEEAQRDVSLFTERYPHGSFREYESFDQRYGKTIRSTLTGREQAALRRIEKALARRSRTAGSPTGSLAKG